MILRRIFVLGYIHSSFSILSKFDRFLCVLRRIIDKKKTRSIFSSLSNVLIEVFLIQNSYFYRTIKKLLEMILRRIFVLGYIHSSFSILSKFDRFLCTMRRIMDKKKKREVFLSDVDNLR